MVRSFASAAELLLLAVLAVCGPALFVSAQHDHSNHGSTPAAPAGGETDHSAHGDSSGGHAGHSMSGDSTMDHSGHAGHSATPGESRSGPMPACATDPTTADCATYMYPDARAIQDIEANCEMMPFMIGCSVWNACNNGDLDKDSRLCQPFNVLAATCQDEGMSGMVGCAVYTPMCLNPNTVVQQCQGSGIQRMVSTMPTQAAIVENCGTHSMPGCQQCTGEGNACPDTLESLQSVCQAHRMEMCSQYNSMCSANGADMQFFCTSRGGKFDPPMRMYFHGGIRDIIWFRDFVPDDDGEYAGAIILCIVVGVIASGLRVYRSVLEASERIERNVEVRQNPGTVASQSIWVLPTAELVPRAGHGVLSFVILTLDYALMLAAMTFNTGIFFAVVAGLTLGLLLFRHIGSRATEKAQARSLLKAPACGCRPEEKGYEAIALGRCCDSANVSSENSPKKEKRKSSSGCGAGNAVGSVEDAAAGAPETTPACCA